VLPKLTRVPCRIGHTAARLRADGPETERLAAFDRAVRWLAVRTAFQPDMPITRDFWTADDALGYGPHADAIAAFVRHRGTRPPLTIGVTAPWGAGKTSLMRMVQERLDPRIDRERWTPTSLRFSDDARKALAPKLGGNADQRSRTGNLLQRTNEPPIDTDVDLRTLDVQPHAERLPDDGSITNLETSGAFTAIPGGTGDMWREALRGVGLATDGEEERATRRPVRAAPPFLGHRTPASQQLPIEGSEKTAR
jgi:hypothetical protein